MFNVGMELVVIVHLTKQKSHQRSTAPRTKIAIRVKIIVLVITEIAILVKFVNLKQQ